MPVATLGDHLHPGLEPISLVSPALAGRFFTTELPGKPLVTKRLQSNMSLQKIEKERKRDAGTVTGVITALEESQVQLSSVTQSRAFLRDLMDCSMPSFPVHNQLSELAQTHVY